MRTLPFFFLLAFCVEMTFAQSGWYWQNPLPQGNHLNGVSFTDAKTSKPLAKFEPPNGKVYHGVGQPPMGIDEYIAAMGDSSIHPLVYKIYYDIPGSRGPSYDSLRVMLAAQKAIGRFVELSIGFQDGRGSTDSIIATSTQHDAVIDSLAAICRDHRARLFVRPGFEFNGPWNGYHPYLYVTAFRKVVDRFRQAGAADSVAFNWCYYPGGAPNDFDSVDVNGPRWYPGDGYVDWFGLDVFDTLDFKLTLPDFESGQITTKGKSERFLMMARLKSKPVFLSETTAKGMNITPDLQDGINDWDKWFVPFWEFIAAHPEVKGFNYINWDWTRIPQYAAWGDARVSNNAYITQRYREEMRKPRYIHLHGSLPTDVSAVQDVPHTFHLYQNYPNPFNPSTTIKYQLPHATQVSLKVYNLLGQEVASLVDDKKEAGYYQVEWRPNSASGIYFYRLQAGDFVQTKKLLLLK
jgi:hypothetical protein